MRSATGIMIGALLVFTGSHSGRASESSDGADRVSSPGQKQADNRRRLGEKYAEVFSDNARGRIVTWDDATCRLTEDRPDSGRPDVHARQSTSIPVLAVTVDARELGPSRMETLEATFRCASPNQRCMSRVHTYGSSVVSSEDISVHAMALRGSVGDVPKLISELSDLQAACSAKAARP